MARASVIADEELDDDYEDDESEEVEEDDSGTDDPTPTPPTNPDYEVRFKGLQGSLQQQVEENQRLNAQLMLIHTATHVQNLIQQGTDPEQAKQQGIAILAGKVAEMKGQALTNKEAALEQASRLMWAQSLAMNNDIDMNSPEFTRLMKVRDVDDMEAMAQLISSKKKTGQRVKRVRKDSDRFGSGTSNSSPRRKKAGSLGAAADRFARIKIDI
jgi:hypothetical protein